MRKIFIKLGSLAKFGGVFGNMVWLNTELTTHLADVEKTKHANTLQQLIHNSKTKHKIAATHTSTRAGHILGLESMLEGDNSKYHGCSELTSLPMYALALTKAHKTLDNSNDEHINEYIETVNFTVSLIKNFSEPSFIYFTLFIMSRNLQVALANKLFDRYKQKKPIYIPSGFIEHHISIILDQEYLIISNRGSLFNITNKLAIYKLKKPLQKQDIVDLIRVKENPPESFTSLFNELVDSKQPILVIPAKPQKHGTCAFTNKKKLMEGFLIYKNIYLCNETKQSDNFQQLLADVRTRYKQYTRTMRDNMLQEIFDNIGNETDKNKKTEHAIYLLDYIFTRLNDMLRDQTTKEKMSKDLNTIKLILERYQIFIEQHIDCQIIPKELASMINFIEWDLYFSNTIFVAKQYIEKFIAKIYEIIESCQPNSSIKFFCKPK